MNKNAKESCKKYHFGITLISLIITIVILLILAGVAISILIGNNAMIQNAKNAANVYQQSSEKEANLIQNLLNTTEFYDCKIDNISIVTQDIGCRDFTIQVNATTIEGSIRKYQYVVNDIIVGESSHNTFNYTGAEPGIEYTVYVLVYDENNVAKKSEPSNVKTEELVYLYNEGDECINLTGGWVKGIFNDTYGANVDLTKNSNSMVLTCENGSYALGGFATNNKIDFSDFKKLCIKYTSIAPANKTIGIAPEKYGYSFSSNSYIYAKYKGVPESSTATIFELDIQNTNEPYYLASHFNGNLGKVTFTIFEVWLEK